MEQVSRTLATGMPSDTGEPDTTPEVETGSLSVPRWRYDSAVHAARALNAFRS
ncbi:MULTISPECIES: hypothetical protein [Nocardioides]|uniref:Uncharacterized protein n=1 Tax=Nocardioides vastitatis TaxID=2568655 RepID=A0ABW0ZHQ3_9ACTN|nr:hypothetical protein [Nocardioides sp.]